MKVIISYELVKAESAGGLTYQVKNLIEKGWQPVGDAKIVSETLSEIQMNYFYQTMVMYEE